MLGSAIVELKVKTIDGEIKIIATGDMGYDEMPLINNPSIIREGDYVIVESTYGAKKRTPIDFIGFAETYKRPLTRVEVY